MSAWCVVPAAGRGERLGGVAKALLPAPGGATFLGAIVAACGAAGIAAARVVVVVGAPHAAAVAAEAARLGARAVENPSPERGMGSSVAAGFAAVVALAAADPDDDPAAPALLWPVDHAHVAPATVGRLLAAARGADVVAPRHAGRGGHPVAVARAAWAALAAGAAGEGGARAVLADRRWRRRDLDVDDPGVIRDVDTPAQRAGRW